MTPDSPQTNPPITPQPQFQQTQNSENTDPGHGLGIASLITSFFIGIVGIILGIIGLNKSKKAGHKNGLALAGIIVGSIQTVFAVIGIVIIVMSINWLMGKCNELGNGTHIVDGVTYTCNLPSSK